MKFKCTNSSIQTYFTPNQIYTGQFDYKTQHKTYFKIKSNTGEHIIVQLNGKDLKFELIKHFTNN